MGSLDAPVPIDALWKPGPKNATVTFSHRIVEGALDPLNWFVRFDGLRRDILTVTVALPGTVVIRTTFTAIDAGPDIVSYSPPPLDVISNTARRIPAAAFADFPLHV